MQLLLLRRYRENRVRIGIMCFLNHRLWWIWIMPDKHWITEVIITDLDFSVQTKHFQAYAFRNLYHRNCDNNLMQSLQFYSVIGKEKYFLFFPPAVRSTMWSQAWWWNSGIKVWSGTPWSALHWYPWTPFSRVTKWVRPTRPSSPSRFFSSSSKQHLDGGKMNCCGC